MTTKNEIEEQIMDIVNKYWAKIGKDIVQNFTDAICEAFEKGVELGINEANKD